MVSSDDLLPSAHISYGIHSGKTDILLAAKGMAAKSTVSDDAANSRRYFCIIVSIRDFR